MQQSIKNHRLADVDFMKARWQGGVITPTAVVLHDTASRLTRLSAARYLADNSAKVSVHTTIERDGLITQHVPFNRRANHAGRSVLNGRYGCNNFTIGIEIVNPGIMRSAGDGKALAWWGSVFDVEDYGIRSITTKEHGTGLWMPYTEAQIDSIEAVLSALLGKYATIRDIVSHWYISLGRKVDTNPLFPLEQLRSRVMGREDFAEADAIDASIEAHKMVRINVPGDHLNMRRWPSFNPNIIHQIPHDTVVPVVRSGTFAERDWSLVLYGGREGWVLDSYLQTA